MREGRSILDLALELDRQLQTKRDFQAPTSKIHVVRKSQEGESPGKVCMLLDGRTEGMRINRTAHQQLASYTKIPMEYYERMLAQEPELLARNVNTWLHRTNETRLVRTLDGNVRAFLSSRYRIIDNCDVADAALQAITDAGCRVISSEVTESRLYLKAVTERVQVTVKGDVVQAGIIIMNSEIGHGSVRVEPLLYILACLNGAIVQDQAVRKFHIGRHTGEAENAYEVFKDDTVRADNKAFMLKLRDAVAASFDEVRFRETAQRVQRTATRRLDLKPAAPLDTVTEVLGRTLRLGEGEAGGVLQHLLRGNDLSQWGLSNAITRFAQEKELTYDRATELERVGGDVLMLPDVEWARLNAEVAATAIVV